MDGWDDPVWMLSGRHAVNAFESIWMGIGGVQVGSVTCVWGRGRPRAEGLVAGRPTLLLSSSRARVSCSNCTSCSLTDSSRAAALSHCSIHTTWPQGEKGGGRVYIHPYSLKYTEERVRNKNINTPLLLNLLCADADLKSKGLYYHSLTHHSSSDTFLGTCWHHSDYTLPKNNMINFEGMLTQILNFLSTLTTVAL